MSQKIAIKSPTNHALTSANLSKPSKGQHIQSLDALRGVCAVMVALMHMRVHNHFFDLPIVRNSWLLVDFFFVLSGFVVAYVYIDRLSTFNDAVRFAVRRFGRLWPLHATMLAGFIGIESLRYLLGQPGSGAATRMAFTGQYSISYVLPNLLLVHALALHQIATWNGPSWSISTEFYTYLVFAAACLLSQRKYILPICALLILVGASVLILYNPTFMQTEGRFVADGMTVPTSNFTWFRCIYGFFCGVVTFYVWKRCPSALPPWSEYICALGAIAFLWFAGETVWSMIAPIVFALVVGSFASETGSLTRVLNKPFPVKLGLLSYSVYMVHPFILSFLGSEQAAKVMARLTHHDVWQPVSTSGGELAMISFGSPWLGDLYTVLVISLVVVVSGWTYRFAEQPGRRFFNRLASRSRS